MSKLLDMFENLDKDKEKLPEIKPKKKITQPKKKTTIKPIKPKFEQIFITSNEFWNSLKEKNGSLRTWLSIKVNGKLKRISAVDQITQTINEILIKKLQ